MTSSLLGAAAIAAAFSCETLHADEWNGSTEWAKFDVEARRAMWVWNPVSVDGNKTANRNWDGVKNSKDQFFANYKGSRDMFFDFCENKSIRVIYMFTGTYQWTNYNSGTIDYAEEHMLDFLKEANERGIQIWYMYYLNDDRDSATLVNNTKQTLTIAKAVDTFNKKYPEARFAGIHGDQEPNDQSVYVGMLENTKRAYDWIEETGSDLLTSQALRPTWRNQSVTYNGETKVMNEHMQDWLHHSVLMAYSDTPNTVYNWSNKVISYAESIGRTAAIGSELADLEDAWTNADKETWYEELTAESDATRFKVGSTDGTTWEDMMHETVNRFEDNAGFDRLVIHTYSWYFKHWFGDYPRDYLLGLEGGEYNSAANSPAKVDLTEDSRELIGYGPVAAENIAPTANAGGDLTLPDSDGLEGETVTLDGSASSDSDGSIVSYVWTENGSQIATGKTASVRLSDGIHIIQLTVTDNDGAESTDNTVIEIAAPVVEEEPTGNALENCDFAGSTAGGYQDTNFDAGCWTRVKPDSAACNIWVTDSSYDPVIGEDNVAIKGRWHNCYVYQEFNASSGNSYNLAVDTMINRSDSRWQPQLSVQWFDASGNELSEILTVSYLYPNDATPNTWYQLSGTAIAPAKAATGRIILHCVNAGNGGVGGIFYFDNAVVDGSFSELTFDDFEDGLGNWSTTGADSNWTVDSTAETAPAGFERSLHLQGKSDSSIAHLTDSIDLSNSSQLRVKFTFQTVRFNGNNGNEDFFLEVYDGSQWVEIGNYKKVNTNADEITTFPNNVTYIIEETVDSSMLNFAADASVRFRCDASGAGDELYIDNVTISAK
ncbi:PKD domain-containing protein [Persicirhabdus sediminis]|uniref:PKD domain-containing protein n=1 Tax=Persicirhabdus sediminis TaxID=454144 RepID=A0A8J7SKY0_9BACT|nr:PKD domain-containing protein [Persicirhabdus sediminis]MBK1791065.1 PKD domain-containing protein [Persicirhabdus sediminis]